MNSTTTPELLDFNTVIASLYDEHDRLLELGNLNTAMATLNILWKYDTAPDPSYELLQHLNRILAQVKAIK